MKPTIYRPLSENALFAQALAREAFLAPTFSLGRHCLVNIKTCFWADLDEGNPIECYRHGLIGRAISHFGINLADKSNDERSNTLDQINSWKNS